MPLKFTNAKRAAALAALDRGLSSRVVGRVHGMHHGYVRQLKSLRRDGKLPHHEPKKPVRRLIKGAGQ